MYFFRRKHFALILCFLILSLFNVVISENITNRIYDIQQVSALPVNEKVIVIDAGHGGEDGGAISSSNVEEADLNLKVALKLQKLLEQAGSTVILTRSDENAIYELDSKTLSQKKVSDIKNRVKIGNNSSADIFISIHMNKIPETQYDGFQTFYNSKSEKGKLLSESIQSALKDTIKRENNRVSKPINNIYIVDHIEIPLSLVECGFLSNSEELNLLMQDKYQEKLAYGIYLGIINYFNLP